MIKKLSLIILTLTLTTMTIFPIKSTQTTSVYVDPEIYEVAGVGQTFTINITVAEVTNLWGWVFKMFYNSTQLNGTALEEGPFLKSAGETFFWQVNFTDNYNASHGYIYAFCHLTHVIPGANGNGTIAKITFKSKSPGSSVLDLTDTKLKNSEGEYMPHETRDGTIVVTGKLCDINNDGKIDYQDDRIFGRAYITYGQTGEVDPRCDFNGDNKIDYQDDRIFGRAYITYGQTGDP